jgi:hypothetical protein
MCLAKNFGIAIGIGMAIAIGFRLFTSMIDIREPMPIAIAIPMPTIPICGFAPMCRHQPFFRFKASMNSLMMRAVRPQI